MGLSAVWAFAIFACFSTFEEDNIRGAPLLGDASYEWKVYIKQARSVLPKQAWQMHTGEMQALYLFESVIFEADNVIFR